MKKKTDKRWRRKKPDANGWWFFKEDGTHCTQRILVKGSCVASDDQWSQAMGRNPNADFSENYWEDSSVEEMTNGKLTSGMWQFDSP